MFIISVICTVGVLFANDSVQTDGYTNVSENIFYIIDSSENGKGHSDKSPFRKRAHQRRKKIRPPMIGK